jgi:hypothetical protein
MKKHRDYDAMPDLSMQIDDFSTDWWQWWEILQPEWRGDGPDFSRDIPEDASWTEICKGGPNGFFIILLSIAWWGVAVQDQSSGIQGDWYDAYEDVSWVLDSMIDLLE